MRGSIPVEDVTGPAVSRRRDHEGGPPGTVRQAGRDRRPASGHRGHGAHPGLGQQREQEPVTQAPGLRDRSPG